MFNQSVVLTSFPGSSHQAEKLEGHVPLEGRDVTSSLNLIADKLSAIATANLVPVGYGVIRGFLRERDAENIALLAKLGFEQ